jgi:hypothetical protein
MPVGRLFRKQGTATIGEYIEAATMLLGGGSKSNSFPRNNLYPSSESGADLGSEGSET